MLGLVLSLIPYGWAVEMILLAALLDLGSALVRGRAFRRALAGGTTQGARQAGRWIARTPATPDSYGVARGAIEDLLRAFTRQVCMAGLGYILLGLPGLAVMVVTSELDRQIGVEGAGTARAYGRWAAGLDSLLVWLPAWISAALLLLATLIVPGARFAGARAALFGADRRAGTGAMRMPIAAVAGALHLKLMGPQRLPSGSLRQAAWLLDHGRHPVAGDVLRVLALVSVAALIQLLLTALLAYGLISLGG
jgi:adenosylcobinamide-phosphate synthase